MDAVFYILIFPGFLFACTFGLAAEYFDRKLHAKLQNRVGPPWFQPLADMIKLIAKEDIVPDKADHTVFRFMPILAFTATLTALFSIPLWKTSSVYAFNGDLIVVLYLLTIPTLTFFLGGWYARSVFSMIGAVRSIIQLFAYEIPLFLSILAPAMLAGTLSLSQMTVFFNGHPWLVLLNLPGFAIAIIALLGKLEKTPFDIPEAETEIVAGGFTEYSGRLLAFFRMTMDVEMVAGASLLAAVFLPFGFGINPAVDFILYIIRVLFVVSILTVCRTILARLRIDQMINFCWKFVAPIAFLQLIADLIVKGFIVK